MALKRGFGLMALLSLGLVGCSAVVDVAPAVHSTSPICASIVVSLRNKDLTASAGGRAVALPYRDTTSQGTLAWGSPASVLVQCGLDSPPPTSDICFTVGKVEWVRHDIGSVQILTTYGRFPAVQARINSRVVSENDVLPLLSDAVRGALPTASRHCD